MDSQLLVTGNQSHSEGLRLLDYYAFRPRLFLQKTRKFPVEAMAL